MLFTTQTKSVIPDLESLFTSRRWQNFEYLFSDHQKVRMHLKPLLNEEGKMSKSQVLFSIRKFFQNYRVTKISQSDFRSDTNYSQIEITAEFELQPKSGGPLIHGSFLFIFNFRKGRPLLTRWAVTDFYS